MRRERCSGLDRGYNQSYTLPMKTAISIPDDLYRTAERAAKRLGLTRSELYRRALGAFLQQHDDQLITDVLNEIHGAKPSHSAVDPILQRIQIASLPPEEW